MDFIRVSDAGFSQAFKSFVVERLESDSGVKDLSPNHLKRYEKARELSKQLMETLTEEQKKLFIEYENADTAAWALTEGKAYTKGLNDGIRMVASSCFDVGFKALDDDQQAEDSRRVDIIIKLGRKIMERLEPRHRYLFLEYERQVNLKNLYFDKQ